MFLAAKPPSIKEKPRRGKGEIVMKFIVRRDSYEKSKANSPQQLHFYDENGYFTFSVHEDWLDDKELSKVASVVDARGEVELHLVWPDDLAMEK